MAVFLWRAASVLHIILTLFKYLSQETPINISTWKRQRRDWLRKPGKKRTPGQWSQPQIGGVPNNLRIHFARLLGMCLSLSELSLCTSVISPSYLAPRTSSTLSASKILLTGATQEFNMVMRPQAHLMVLALYSYRFWNFLEGGLHWKKVKVLKTCCILFHQTYMCPILII